MSQAKVDKYKKDKVNRKKEMAKKKVERVIGIICGCAILVALVGWAGYTGYNYYEDNKPANTYYTNTSALNDYVSSLNTEAE